MSFENNCKYVSSRGILKSCDIHSDNPKSSCNNDYQYLIDMIRLNKMFDGISIYVCSDLLTFFIQNILPKIKHKFTLVTGDSDLCVPIEACNKDDFFILLNSCYLIRWFAQNTRIQTESKLIQLPIGLDYHTIYANPNHHWRMNHECHLPSSQEEILINIKNNSKHFDERIKKIYVNFTLNNDRFNDRKSALNQIPKDLLDNNLDPVPRTKNWEKISSYKFVLSPFGYGMDCHRTWEALCLGCIPIVRAPNFKNLFSDLPVLIVNNWNEVNEDLLDHGIRMFKENNFNYNKLKLEYWTKKISNVIE